MGGPPQGCRDPLPALRQGSLLVDFTLALSKRGWRVAEQATYSANGKRFFDYTKNPRRVAVKETSEPVEIKIDGGRSDERKAPAEGSASVGGGPSPGLDAAGVLPHGDGPDPNLKSPPALDD